MKKSRLTILLAICVMAFCAAALTGCSSSFDPIKEGYSVTVTYDSNGGKYSNNDKTGVKVFRYKPGSVIMEPGVTNSEFVRPTKEGFNARAWYACVLDENGEPVKDSDGNFTLAEEPWNFATDKTGEENSKIYLVAYWSKNYLFTVDVGDEAREDGVENLVFNNYTEPSKLSAPGIPPEWEGHTLHYYQTAEGERITDFGTLYISDDNPEITVYVKWLDGVWNIINNSHDLSNGLSQYNNYYLDSDIDFGIYDSTGNITGKGAFLGAVNFEGKFEGNGYTISNFVFSTEKRGVGLSNTTAGLFSFRGNGYVRNVKFVNCSVQVDLYNDPQDGYNIGFVAGNVSNVSDLGVFENLELSGCELIITKYGKAKENNVAVNVGEKGYEGFFGKIAEDASFTVPDDKLGITININ